MSNKNFFLILLLFIIPFFSYSQVTKFMGRYEVSQVDSINDSTWTLTGTFVDVTGSYTALDADTGFKILQRGTNSLGQVVYDRYVIRGILSQTSTDLVVNVESDYPTGIQNSFGYPLNGAFPIAAPVNDSSSLTYRASMYLNEIDLDYDAALDNLNIGELNVVAQEAYNLFRYTVYSVGNNTVEVLASTPNITASLAGTQFTFVIPVGTRIISAKIRVESFSSLTFIMGTNDLTNSSMANRWMPVVQAWREDTGQQLTGITSVMDLSNFTKSTVNGLISSTKCQVRIVF